MLRFAALCSGLLRVPCAADRPIQPVTGDEVADAKAGAVLAALAAIWRERGPEAATRTAVADALGVDPGTATRYLRRREARGLVRRRRHGTGGAGRPRDVYEVALAD